MAKAKKSMVEKQQSADVAEQAHRLAHELGLAHGHSHTEENESCTNFGKWRHA